MRSNHPCLELLNVLRLAFNQDSRHCQGCIMTEQKHGTPADGMECMCCMDDIDDTNYVEYRTGEGAVDERQASQRTLRTSHSLAGASVSLRYVVHS